MDNEWVKRTGCLLMIIILTSCQVASVLADEIFENGYGYGYFMIPVKPDLGELLINEFQSRPEAGQPEWIELFNSTQKNLSLEGCELRDAVGLITQFSPEVILASGQYHLHNLNRTKLNNSGDSITLSCDEQIIDEVRFGKHSPEKSYRSSQGFEEERGYLPAAGKAKSLARFPDGSSTWFIFGEPTPDKANEVQNESPQAIITLQGTKKTSGCDSLSVNVTGENSIDPDGDSLTYSWEYLTDGEDAIPHSLLHSTERSNPLSFKFEKSMGKDFNIHLTLSDPFGGSHSTNIQVTLGQCSKPKSPLVHKPPVSSFQLSANIHISELFPNPSGKDSGNEFVELYNSGPNPVHLDGWSLGSKTKKKLDGQMMAPFGFLIFKNITLRNSGDTIQLIDPVGNVQSEVHYEKAQENKSWSRHPSGSFRWTIPSPGRQNDFPFQKESIYLQATSPLIITQFLPNPKGRDEGNEWVEIMNRSDRKIDLSQWQLDNRDGGSKAYLLSGTLHPQQTLRVLSSQSKVTLRNSSDQVRLLSSSDQVIDLLEWSSPAPDGKVFQRNQLIRDLSIDPDIVRVLKVIDGDTIDVEVGGDIERVRLIGVDTPETVHPFKPLEKFGKEASEFTRRKLEGKEVRLEYDLVKRGKYGRLLAYVWVEERVVNPNVESGSWKHFNAELVQKGYAFAYLRYPFKYREEFRQLEIQAQQAGEGLWESSDIKSIREQQELVFDEELEELEIIEELLEDLEKEPEEIIEEEIQELPPEAETKQYDQTGWDQLLINEILPNPKGKDSDGGEFIELKYSGSKEINLEGWIIKNSKAKIIWKFDEDYFVRRTSHALSVAQNNPHLLLIHPKSPIKNTSESLSLIDPLGQTRDSYSYDESMKDDQVWARHNETKDWHVLVTATPGLENPQDFSLHMPQAKQKKKRKKKSKKLKPLYDVIEQSRAPSRGIRLFPFARAASSNSFKKESEPLYVGGSLTILLLLALLFNKYLGMARSRSRKREPTT
jgi:endonuclease YncB( thermonuclease family)